MRTRIYNKLNVKEIEAYINKGGSTIFLPLGVIECHGAYPVDVETVLPQAFAKLLAEKADGLVLTDLPYFYAGGTVISDATIHISIKDGIDYLDKLCTSLVQQGFRHIFFVSGHGPASITIDAFSRDFFEKTGIHPCHLEVFHMVRVAFPNASFRDVTVQGTPLRIMLNELMCGAYKVLDIEDALLVDPNAPKAEYDATPVEELVTRFEAALTSFGGVPSRLFSHETQHSNCIQFESVEARDEVCTRGAEYIQQIIDAVNMDEVMQALDGYQAYVRRVVAEHPRLQKLFKDMV